MKILLADPHPEVRSALHLVLDQIPGVTVMAEVDDVIRLLAQNAYECPDLILLDPELVGPYRFRRQHGKSLADAISVLHKLCPFAKVVAMSSRFDAGQEALAAGADGFISKTDPIEMVWAGIARLWEKGQDY